MTNRRISLVLLLALFAALGHAQSWMAAYEKGLKSGQTGDWVSARSSFKDAIAYRPEDASGPTTLPGPVANRRQWRDGAPYSPNFLAAYSEYRIAAATPVADDAKPAYQTAASEFETLLNKSQNSRETFYFLEQIYARLGDTAKRLDIENKFKATKINFRVDDEIVSPTELATITGAPAGGKTNTGTGPTVTVIKPGQSPTPLPGGGNSVTNPGTVAPSVGPVSPIPTKYALVVGNSTSQAGKEAVTFGADDAQAVREALISNAGYPEANVDLVLNTTREQLLASAKALADRVPDDGTVFIFFAGNGVNIDGKDYLACVDTPSFAPSNAGTMVAKMDLYQLFMNRGAKIFAFFEVPRPIVNASYFGKEIPLVGSIAQIQSTIPGETVYADMHNGRPIGIFAQAIVSAFQDIRSNRIPIMEFGWQVFNRIRGGGSTTSGAGARQVPTLPVLTHLSDLDRF